ncbi:MAG: outer membrane lipoprotein-sorting protein [Bdellovibrionales bacterium]|nr:outer membrane lipoprotein-sorting protein [Bdellovibrionales bacterium]
MKNSIIALFATVTLASAVHADSKIKDLPYPKGNPSALELAQQNQYVDKFYGMSRMPIAYQPTGRAVLLTGKKGGSLFTTFVERYINTAPVGTHYLSQELSVFLSGKNQSLGFLISDFADDQLPMFQVWSPELRKVRRMPTPLFDDRWGGSDFTWGEMLLQRPEFETHKIVDAETFNRCLGTLQTKAPAPWADKIPQGSCYQQERPVYVLKSIPTFSQIKEYDYRIRFIDAQTFADYRTEYYAGGQLIRVVEKNWGPMGMEDPRIQGWSYMYGYDLRKNTESMFLQVDRNTTWKPKDGEFWSDQTLRRLHR